AGCDRIAFEVATAADVTPPDGGFDAVLAFNLWHLVPDRAAALRHVRRVSKPGALFISKTPCLSEMHPAIRLAVPVMRAVGLAPRVVSFTASDLEAEIADAGFTVIERARHGSSVGTRASSWSPSAHDAQTRPPSHGYHTSAVRQSGRRIVMPSRSIAMAPAFWNRASVLVTHWRVEPTMLASCSCVMRRDIRSGRPTSPVPSRSARISSNCARRSLTLRVPSIWTSAE
ncbi:MAG: class I SAM-dependent methyltransferase, partial [Rhodospirillales bacterium]|nr:class I SAM-dependent methyltransferase [Rhodospirillales bacterium]